STSSTIGQVQLNAGTLTVGSAANVVTAEFSSAVGATLSIASTGTVTANYGAGTTTTLAGTMSGAGTFAAHGAGEVIFASNITGLSLNLSIGGTSIGSTNLSTYLH